MFVGRDWQFQLRGDNDRIKKSALNVNKEKNNIVITKKFYLPSSWYCIARAYADNV